jgi:hypothetical protein
MKKQMLTNLCSNILISLLIVFLISCGSSFKDQPLQGKYDGQDWSLKSAKVSKNPLDTSVFVVELTDQSLTDPCGLTTGGKTITTTCPQKVGKHEFGMLKLRFANFTSSGSNLMATDGAIEILNIDKDKKEVKGRMMAKYDDKNTVNGNFSAKICDETSLEKMINTVVDSIKTLTPDSLKKK